MAGKTTVKEDCLFVVNMVRSWKTRLLRRQPGGKRHRFNMIICGGKIRLLRKKSQLITKEIFEAFKDELEELQRQGKIEIRVGGPNGPRYEFSETLVEEQLEDTEEEEVEDTVDEPDDTDEEEVHAESLLLPPKEESEPEEIPSPSKPLERMNKTELIEYCVSITDLDPDELKPMIKRDILEVIKGALE